MPGLSCDAVRNLRVDQFPVNLLVRNRDLTTVSDTYMQSSAASDGPKVAIWSETLASRYEALIRLAAMIRSKPEEEDLFETLANELHQVVSFDGLCQLDPGANRVRWHFLEPFNKEMEALPEGAIPRDETVAWWVLQNQQAVVIRLEDREAGFPRCVEWLAKVGLRSLYVLPLSTAHRQLGTLALASRFDDAYSTEDQRFLSLVADQIAIALDDARVQQRMKLLLELTNRLVPKLDLRDLLQETSAIIRRIMRCEAVGVVLPAPEDGELRRYFVDSPGQENWHDGPVSEHARTVFQTGQAANLTKKEITDTVNCGVELNSLCLYPLISCGRVLGVLGFGSSREGAFTLDDRTFLGQVANQVALAVENACAYRHISGLKDKVEQENVYLESEIRSELHFEDIVGSSDPLRSVLKEVETVAPADSTVLIYGETGTGKELIARALHNLSSRRSNAFVKLNCAAIPTGLLESELFGHEKGAFTGAIAQRVGRFELANRGTIFLDEIGEIPLELQPKLLRVLQEREFERLGSSRTVRTDARLIAATNRDLKTMVEEQKFRSDLYYRLNVFPIRVPALRERKEDIPLLVRHFVQEFTRRNNRVIDTIPTETMQALIRYHWPGNIRELQNVIERAVIISRGPVLNVSFTELQPHVSSNGNLDRTNGKPAPPEDLENLLEQTERTHILHALEETNGVVAGPNGAAARLRVKESTFRLRMQKLGIRLSRMAINGRG